MLTRSFAVGALDRAAKTFAQSLLVLWGADSAFNVFQVDVPAALGVAVSAAVLSLLTSLASAPVAERGTTSFLPGGR